MKLYSLTSILTYVITRVTHSECISDRAHFRTHCDGIKWLRLWVHSFCATWVHSYEYDQWSYSDVVWHENVVYSHDDITDRTHVNTLNPVSESFGIGFNAFTWVRSWLYSLDYAKTLSKRKFWVSMVVIILKWTHEIRCQNVFSSDSVRSLEYDHECTHLITQTFCHRGNFERVWSWLYSSEHTESNEKRFWHRI